MKDPRNLVGPTVRRLRYAMGLSQPELAARAQRMGWDMGRDVIAKIETQARWVSDFELAGLAKVLGVSAARLVPKTDDAMRQLNRRAGRRAR